MAEKARGQVTIAAVSDGVGIASSSVSYARSASYKSAPTSGWQSSPPQLTDAYPYLWTRTVLTLTDGTQQTAYSVSYKGEKGDGTYIYTAYATDVTDLDADGYTSKEPEGFSLTWFSGAVWMGVCVSDVSTQDNDYTNYAWSKIKGEQGDPGGKGDPGEKGADAVTLVATPGAVTFDTDENGSLSGASAQKVLITYSQGSLTGQVGLTIKSVTATGFTATPAFSGRVVTIDPTKIATQTVTVDGEEKAIARTQASVTVMAVTDGGTAWVTIPVSVNVAAYWGSVEQSNAELRSQYTSLNTKVGTLDSDYAELEQRTSVIEQTSEEISMKVYEPQTVRKNVLAGSAFRRHGDGGFDWTTPYAVTKLGGYGGVNAVRLCSTLSGVAKSISYAEAATKTGSQYTLSMLLYSASAGKSVKIVCGGNSYTEKIATAGVWTVWHRTFTATAQTTAISVTPTDAAYDIMVCRLMLRAGSYSGWTLSESDTAYVGGNMIDNALTLVVGGNLSGRGERSETGDGDGSYMATRSGESGKTNTLLNLKFTDIEPSQDYMFSFYAKNTALSGGQIAIEAQGYMALAELSNGRASTNTVEGGGGTLNGSVWFAPSDTWERYWLHLRTTADAPSAVWLYVGAQNSITACLKKPKLEKGMTMTDFTASQTDMVEDIALKDRLLPTGIDIDRKSITLTAEKTTVQLNDGTKVAVFDQDGLNADLITAKKLSTSGAEAHVEIADGLIEIFGKTCCNIRFGVNAEGYAVLSYYDNEGKWLYDLGPNKLDSSNNQGATLTAYTMADIADIAGVADGTVLMAEQTFIAGDDNMTCYVVVATYSAQFFGARLYATDNDEVDKNGGAHKGFCPAKGKVTQTIYRYTAGKLSNAYMTDTARGLTTAALAKEADGKWFTSDSVLAKNGALTNLAEGSFILKTDTVGVAVHPDASALDDGASYQWPAYSVRMYRFVGGLADIGKLYSDIVYTYSVGTVASAVSDEDEDENAAVD